MRPRRFGSTSLWCLVVACGGGRIDQSWPPGPPGDAGSVFDVAAGTPQPPGFLQPLLPVSAGWVLEGTHFLDEGARKLVSEDHCIDGAPRTLWATACQLMKYEVTNSAYQQCVRDGTCLPPDVVVTPAWDSPQADRLPAVVSYPLAQAFCRHYGGDLPTNVQWDRAAAGDVQDGVPPLAAQWLSCHYGGSAGSCAQLASATSNSHGGEPPFALVAAGANGWDVSPFGHMDMYGNAEEWVRSSTIQMYDKDFCALADFSADPLTFAPELQVQGWVRQLGNIFLQPGSVDHFKDTQLRIYFPYYVRPQDAPSSSTGFRCAFP